MAKKEIITDLSVYEMLKDAGLKFNLEENYQTQNNQNFCSAQGSDIKEIEEALSTASKKGTGKRGYPEYVCVVKDFLIVIENKPTSQQHIKKNDKNLINDDPISVQKYAVNGALFYGRHLAKKTNFKKIIAIGVSGNAKNHKISPLFIKDFDDYMELNEVETFISFNPNNITEYYEKEILQIETEDERKTEDLLKIASSLNEDLRNYGNLEDKNKPLIVSGILLALSEIKHNNFSVLDLVGDTISTDGSKIYKAIKDHLDRANVSPQVKKDKLLSHFNIIKDNNKINQYHSKLGKTPLRHFTEVLHKEIFTNIKYNKSSEDYIGRFYAEFMSYSGGDAQSLGIVLTPKHITDLFCELLDIKPSDKILDPCCGTGSFLIGAMHHMLSKTKDENEREEIKKNRLFGIELQDYMFTIATTNMILRGDGKSNLENQDFLAQDSNKLQLKGCTVGMMNPPYSQGSKENNGLYEINFVNHLLESLAKEARVAVIVPQSTFTGGKGNIQKNLKTQILKKHTLEGVITLNENTFYNVGTHACIGIFTAGVPHNKTKKSKFINFKNDGYIVRKHIGLVDDGSAKDKKQYLLDVWNNKIEAPTKFSISTTIKDTDEWLHSFYYFNDEIPTNKDFEKAIADYLTFETNMFTHGHNYLFDIEDNNKDHFKDTKNQRKNNV